MDMDEQPSFYLIVSSFGFLIRHSTTAVVSAPIGLVAASGLVAPIHRSHGFSIGFFSNVVDLYQEMLGSN